MKKIRFNIDFKTISLFIILLSLSEITSAQCNQIYNWTTWTSFTGNSATGTIINNGQPIAVTMTANYTFGSTPSVYNYSLFSGFTTNLPNATVPQTTWAAGAGGTTTMCFSQTVENPVLLISSLGDIHTPVKLTFSKHYVSVYEKGGMTFPDDTTIIGAEGNAVIVFPGKFDCVTIFSTTPEYYTNITWGLNPPLFPVTISGNTVSCDSVTLAASGGTTYLWSDGKQPNAATNTFYKSGTYFLTVTDANACTVTTSKSVTVNQKATSVINKTICSGNSFEGYTTSGTYKDIFTGVNGCDSIRTLNLVVNQKTSSIISKTICQGDSFEGYSSSGTFIDHFTGSNGCDSTRTLNLTVNQKKSSTINKTICEGDSFEGHSSSGTFIDHFTGSNGCDSARTLNLTVNQKISSTISKSICRGEYFEGYNSAGSYVDKFIAANGCDSTRTLLLAVTDLPSPSLGIDKEICSGDSLLLNPGVFDSYLWQDGSTLNYYIVRQPGVYSVQVSNTCGSNTDQVMVASKNCTLFFPNAFTPNHDGLNDIFSALNAYNLKDFRLAVYNCFGERVFETTNYLQGWDGNYKGKAAVPGVYVWYCTFATQTVPLKGTVTLIR